VSIKSGFLHSQHAIFKISFAYACRLIHKSMITIVLFMTCLLFKIYCLLENHRLWRWFPEESTNGTDVPLIRPPYRGRIKPPALRVVVDFFDLV
jgi:hypothetical protein